jgi:hypothetical protein
MSHEPPDPFYDQRTELIAELQRSLDEAIEVANKFKAAYATERDECGRAIGKLVLQIAMTDALVASLPKCDQCEKPATRSPGRGRERRCDDHAHISRVPGESFYCRDEYPRAAPLRAIQQDRLNRATQAKCVSCGHAHVGACTEHPPGFIEACDCPDFVPFVCDGTCAGDDLGDCSLPRRK